MFNLKFLENVGNQLLAVITCVVAPFKRVFGVRARRATATRTQPAMPRVITVEHQEPAEIAPANVRQKDQFAIAMWLMVLLFTGLGIYAWNEFFIRRLPAWPTYVCLIGALICMIVAVCISGKTSNGQNDQRTVAAQQQQTLSAGEQAEAQAQPGAAQVPARAAHRRGMVAWWQEHFQAHPWATGIITMMVLTVAAMPLLIVMAPLIGILIVIFAGLVALLIALAFTPLNIPVLVYLDKKFPEIRPRIFGQRAARTDGDNQAAENREADQQETQPVQGELAV